jgi:hypothetical protein
MRPRCFDGIPKLMEDFLYFLPVDVEQVPIDEFTHELFPVGAEGWRASAFSQDCILSAMLARYKKGGHRIPVAER